MAKLLTTDHILTLKSLVKSLIETIVPAWARNTNKPTYNYSEIQSTPDLSVYLTLHQDISNKVNTSDLAIVAKTGSYNDLLNKPSIPSKISELVNDSNFLTLHQSLQNYALKTLIPTTLPASDVKAWAKADNKPTYTASEVGAATQQDITNALNNFTLTDALKLELKGEKGEKGDTPSLANYATKTELNSYKPKTLDYSGYIETQGEVIGHIIIPNDNDIAFNDKLYSCKLYRVELDDEGNETNTVEVKQSLSALFNGNTGYWLPSSTDFPVEDDSKYKIRIELDTKKFTYSKYIYISFGASMGWKECQIDVRFVGTYNNEPIDTGWYNIYNGGGGNTKYNLVTIADAHNKKYPTSAYSFNKIRITLHNSVYKKSSNRRIAQIGVKSYEGAGLSTTLLNKGGDTLYGTVSPYKNNTVDLGTSALKYNNVYANRFMGEASEVSKNATTIQDILARVSVLEGKENSSQKLLSLSEYNTLKENNLILDGILYLIYDDV